MADAVSPKEAELRREFEAWKATLKKCVGYGGGCDGDLVGLEHSDHCPMRGGQFTTHWDSFQAGFEAGERKERERCAKLAESFVGEVSPELWPDGLVEPARRCDIGVSAKAAKNIARVIRGGESTT